VEERRDLIVLHGPCTAGTVFIVAREMGRRMIWIGTCGFGRRQADAFRDLQAVEVQQTFYRPVDVDTARRWRVAAPDDFVFTVKASQFITHPASSPTYRRGGRIIPPAEAAAYGMFQETPAVEEGWRATAAVAEALRAMVIVVQCPASFGPSEDHVASLYRFFENAETAAVRAWEPRGGWPTHLVEKVCEDLGLVHAVDPFARDPATYGAAYFRLHGNPPGAAMYRYTYTDADLQRLRTLCGEYEDAFVFFNNMTRHADANRFRSLAATRGAG
jgi:uncharacterized protein YecE (DUF72 family)